jgi:hypothetical protein
MTIAGIQGARRSTRVRTTRADSTATRHPDLVGRDFPATAPNRLWVTDPTSVPTWAWVAYVCHITDVRHPGSGGEWPPARARPAAALSREVILNMWSTSAGSRCWASRRGNP